jgi:hypothetical protein
MIRRREFMLDSAQLEALKGRTTMWTKQRASWLLAGAVVALVVITAERAYAQEGVRPGPRHRDG